jgi:hypothetical protein
VLLARRKLHTRAGARAIQGWIDGNRHARISRLHIAASLARVLPPEQKEDQELRELRSYANKGPFAVVHSDGNHKVATASFSAPFLPSPHLPVVAVTEPCVF